MKYKNKKFKVNDATAIAMIIFAVVGMFVFADNSSTLDANTPNEVYDVSLQDTTTTNCQSSALTDTSITTITTNSPTITKTTSKISSVIPMTSTTTATGVTTTTETSNTFKLKTEYLINLALDDEYIEPVIDEYEDAEYDYDSEDEYYDDTYEEEEYASETTTLSEYSETSTYFNETTVEETYTEETFSETTTGYEEETYEEEEIVEEEYASLPITEDERILLCNLVGREYGQDYISTYEKAKVVAVVMNRVRSDDFPDTIYDVLTQPYQFSGYYVSYDYVWQVTDSVIEAVDYYFNHEEEFSSDIYYFYGDGYYNYFY